ncbi:MAG: right-handed parallel beta-helix repeat-containing protein [Armatimonadetes bacterium]|nr:right-handed parallel beta-helix repeat-containing protein [Armatimonadota bacterium]
MKKVLFPFIFILLSLNLFPTDVQGHISEDTTWSPDNNPYIVIDNIFVDPNVTLTILPGTIVKFNTSTYPIGDYNYGDGYSEAKFMKVSGKLKAEGTAQDSIIFTKNCEETDRRWGVIIFDYQSDNTSVLKHCVIEYTYQMSLLIGGDTYYGGLSLSNAEITVSNCYFKNFYFGIHCFYNSEPVIYNNYFTSDENNIEPGLGIYCRDNIGAKPFIFYNRFINSSGIGFHEVNISSYTPVAYNYFYNCNNGIHLRESPVYVYKNNFLECSAAINTDDFEVVIKQNYIDSCSNGIIAHYKVEVYENIITNGGAGITLSCNNSIIENNIISNNSYRGIRNFDNNSSIMNNLIINNEGEGIYASGSDNISYITQVSQETSLHNM